MDTKPGKGMKKECKCTDQTAGIDSSTICEEFVVDSASMWCARCEHDLECHVEVPIEE